ncbi:hypothetical protein AL073_00340 [Loktanella sp. 1ANDIMAR09]|nr:hypothetical protein AL073_00340 [Loktanella sp. 1ANDIMAR09]
MKAALIDWVNDKSCINEDGKVKATYIRNLRGASCYMKRHFVIGQSIQWARTDLRQRHLKHERRSCRTTNTDIVMLPACSPWRDATIYWQRSIFTWTRADDEPNSSFFRSCSPWCRSCWCVPHDADA